ncbi:CoA ester lyase [Sphingomonas sp.]|jgi:citrate lyase subunit beta/citryl-CoA lyase|uniref:HpcH/HpaI aldolase/citrate lyase family protein n=1 Tax=Sphingomonas sp. TaxID=28214 RepID=UPI002EDA18BE
MTRPIRSALYMPASNPRAIMKARDLACDAVILDLEDAVAPEEKPRARAAAVAAAREGGFGGRTLVVRVNAIDTEWGAADLVAVAGVGFDAVLVPKVDGPGDVHRYAAAIGDTALWIMIETCRSVFALEPLAACAHDAALTTFVLGTNDLAKEMRARLTPERAPFLPFLAHAVAAARIHGLSVLDGVYNAIDDADGFARACAQSVEYGCDGRTLIHPSQIAACNAAFSPGEAEIAHACAIVAAFDLPENRDKGAVRVGGAMAERLHLAEAQRTLALAER